jgi:4-diphosphocytidyl-2-C-methyl-D-erythritol kinase
MLEIMAYAKINLTLEVLGKRPDGYHDICSVIQPINLYDTLSFENCDDIIVSCDIPGWSMDKSLVAKAVVLASKESGLLDGIKIDIKKNIPLLSGLGGDSSDVAAVLNGLNILWNLDMPPEKLGEMAERLGSDVFYFLEGGTSLVEGRGEKIRSLSSLSQMWAVIVLPDVPRESGKTAVMYAALRPAHFTDGQISRKLADNLASGYGVDFSLLFNTFENIAFKDFTIRRVYVDHLQKLGAPHVHLCGSGPAVYTLFEDKAPAEELYDRCCNHGMEVYLVETI